MSIVKDFVLPLLLFCVAVYCFSLKRSLIFQKKKFSEIMKHDLKIPLLAQKRALELVNCSESELLTEVKNSSDEILNMVETAINAYEDYNEDKVERINLSKLVVDVFEELLPAADRKNIDFYLGVDSSIEIVDNVIRLKKFLQYTIISLIEICPQNGKIGIFCRCFGKITEIKIAGNVSEKPKIAKYHKGKISTVGHAIRELFRKNFLKIRGWKCIEKTEDNCVKTFTIYVSAAKEIKMSKAQMQTLLR